MFFEEDEKKYKCVAPDIDRLVLHFDQGSYNARKSTPELLDAMTPIFELLKPLAPLKENNDAKAIWLRIPRGQIEDYGSFEEMKEYGEVDTYEEYEQSWCREYPDECVWYKLVIVQCFEKDGSLRYYAMKLGNKFIISANFEDNLFGETGYYPEKAAVQLCSLLIPAIEEAVRLLKDGKYNTLVEEALPYQFRTGVIRRSDLWSAVPEIKRNMFDGLSDDTVNDFEQLISSGVNDIAKIGRIKEFTANDFFYACKLGYEAIGKDCKGLSLSEIYMRYSDGRDEGLTGKGHGLNARPGIDYDDPVAWDDWYFHRQQRGGHPWEVVPGGNSTHMELYVANDKLTLEWDYKGGRITAEEYNERLKESGYYFQIAGMHRKYESISFYIALSKAGLPIIITNGDELMASFKGTDYVGIVPHDMPTRYCEELFPNEYGRIFDYGHVYKDEDCWFDKIKWLPEAPSELVTPEG